MPILLSLSNSDSFRDYARGNPSYLQSLEIKTDNCEVALWCLNLSQCYDAIEFITGLPSIYRTTNFPTVCYQSTLRPDPNDGLSFILESKVLWKDSFEPFGNLSSASKQAFVNYFPGSEQFRESPTQRQSCTPSDFYNSVHVPKKQVDLSALENYKSIRCQLLPFQERSVGWLLKREGVKLPDGTLRPIYKDRRAGSQNLPETFIATTDAEGRPCFVSHVYCVAASDLSDWPYSSDIRGGILAEEMGLGKTVELLSLICLHRRTSSQPKTDLISSGATLIVTPPAILEQWKQEISRHAPHLRYMQYEGLRPKLDEYATAKELASYDIVLTTYPVLRKEVHYAVGPPDRPLRNNRSMKRRKSPLILLSWWRVCIDEAQMVESGVSNTAKVARIIPRCNSWAVTGTPLRKDLEDLFGLLLFLQYEPFCYSLTNWARICNDFKPVFKSLVKKLALRHNKDVVQDELQLPRQKRVVITIPFTPIEEQNYEQLFQQMCEECGFDLNGTPLDSEDPRPVEKMRTWLLRLRQACLHPEVVVMTRRGFGGGPLRSVGEVLEVMIDQNESQLRSEERGLIMSQIRRGQLLENAERPREALKIWKTALCCAEELVGICRRQVLEAVKKTDSNDLEALSLSDVDAGSESEDGVDNSRLGVYQLRLRGALEVEHMCRFFIASAYYQIKTDPKLTEPNSEDYLLLEKLEEENYEAAKLVRLKLLAKTNKQVNKHINVVRVRAEKDKLIRIPQLNMEFQPGGIESQRIMDKMEDFSDALNQHTAEFNKWRDHMVKLILRPLVDDEDGANLQGDEYESSTKVQDEMYAYMEALRAMVADHHLAITGQRSALSLVGHELTQALQKAKKGEGPCPKLFVSLINQCENLKIPEPLGSLREILYDLRNLIASLDFQQSGGSARAATELRLLEDLHKAVSKAFSLQSKALTGLEREIVLFQHVTNMRLEYYRQLQHISDTVAPYDEQSKGKPLDQRQFNLKIQTEEKTNAKIAGLKSKHRYLLHLRDEASGGEATRICVICQSSFETG